MADVSNRARNAAWSGGILYHGPKRWYAHKHKLGLRHRALREYFGNATAENCAIYLVMIRLAQKIKRVFHEKLLVKRFTRLVAGSDIDHNVALGFTLVIRRDHYQRWY